MLSSKPMNTEGGKKFMRGMAGCYAALAWGWERIGNLKKAAELKNESRRCFEAGS
jgi:hypothetical protein